MVTLTFYTAEVTVCPTSVQQFRTPHSVFAGPLILNINSDYLLKRF